SVLVTAMTLSLGFWILLLLLISPLFIGVWSACCKCPTTRCSVPQWPCCNKKSRWWHNVLG
ncbi:uncharacterized protein LOC116656004, partial [Drosophila ananassae]|uniref:uncharacterized protein LOC116656004 n=1 Tax=Drosophila ananassae TaxID=7217 RepID=UPI001CFFE973